MSEWLDEPDKEEFEHAGLKCLILRHLELGHLCGYVAVPKGHPCYGRGYDHIPYDDLFRVEVHGGLTYSRAGDGNRRPEGYWWLGFDCAHAWDLVPYIPFVSPGIYKDFKYKNFKYVRRETEDLAEQVATLEFIDWEFAWVWPLLLPARTARGIWGKRKIKRMGEKDKEEAIDNQERVFVTDDKAVREGVLSQADEEILESVKTGEGLITIKSVEELKEMVKAAGERFEEFRELCSPMTLAQAKAVRQFRVEYSLSWRAIAEACHKLGWGKWSPPSNQIMGMALCERAAEFFGENYQEPPWN